ncbi:MAG TPA: citramalate synthase [Actinomycetota bacterium]|nr:citramalate synthase [Actinomycetota bacterium]
MSEASPGGNRRVDLYDTTLRDGTQRAGIALSVDDKIRVLERLDRAGLPYVEGGWPGSNPKDAEFFSRARAARAARHPHKAGTVLTCFGMTRRPRISCDDDPQLAALVETGCAVACIVGKSWTLHVREALRVTLDENIAMVAESVRWLRDQGMRVFFDAEHFFQGYAEDPEYALSVVQAAGMTGAEVVVLCDTNGGTLPHDVEAIVATVVERVPVAVGGHFHDDSGCGVANSLAAVRAGASQIQGCVNGYGERCGNADLLAVAANLQLKMGIRVLDDERIAELTDVSRYVSEVANQPPEGHRAFVGTFAFAHKGGLHVSAVMRTARAYEHIDPATVGNDRRLLTSDLSGAATLRAAAANLHLDMDNETIGAALERLKRLEFEGYSFEAADGSLELLLREAQGWRQQYFQPLSFRAIVEDSATSATAGPVAEATVRLEISGERSVSAAEGHGPVDALYRALRVALRPTYPEIGSFHLTDYKVHILDPASATAATVRVLIETTDASGSWMTVGVSTDIIEASWRALIDAVVVGLVHRGVTPAGAIAAAAPPEVWPQRAGAE